MIPLDAQTAATTLRERAAKHRKKAALFTRTAIAAHNGAEVVVKMPEAVLHEKTAEDLEAMALAFEEPGR